MSLPMYLLRRSTSNLSSALYDPTCKDITVYITNPQSDNHIASQQAAFIQGGHADCLPNREPLTYRQLVELILKAEKVVTL
jgi:hypothetical protein